MQGFTSLKPSRGPQELPEPLLDRYEWVRELGQGGQGRTFLARDLRTTQLVTVKELLLCRMDNWKVMELFEREARVLESLSHPAIPAYIDFLGAPIEA